jgi:hypothetical protein
VANKADTPTFQPPHKISEAGLEIYGRIRETMEASYPGQFVVIDVITSLAYPNRSAQAAIEAAKSANPSGVFFLVRVGATGAFKVSHTLHADRNRVLQGFHPSR